MNIDIISVLPGMFTALTEHGVVGRALSADNLSEEPNNNIDFRVWNPRDYAEDKHNSVDDRPYGGGPGMVMMAKPLTTTIAAIREFRSGPDNNCYQAKVVYLSPQGRKVNQKLLGTAVSENIILLCGRYEGVDQRLLDTEVDEEWSIGDYILSGGEIAAMVVVDALVRLMPGSLGNSESANQDSFSEQIFGLLDCPHYTRPEEYRGMVVPEVLLSGDHAAIEQWRREQSLIATRIKRPDLLKKND
ncbi:MAG TPA: tRNA (guanosine(37)-N1)-methyltransferase TrmD [Gammaproteobacteria bacterium]|nr:tRNA (guanosine(37)-N1)-methyltransferase TrmD [Gammaproteobacteria bacterium]